MLSLIRWTAIYPLDNVIHPLYNWTQAIDNKCEAALVLLDLSAAFDTTNHAILLDRLRERCVFAKRFFFRLNHTLKIFLNALPSIRFFLDQDTSCGVRETGKIQRLQNTATSLTVCMKKTIHITPGFLLMTE